MAAALFTGLLAGWSTRRPPAARPLAARRRARPAVACAPPPGHLFVVHGDLRRIFADDVLFPTRNLSHPVWFPDGPPEGAVPIDSSQFNTENRVHRVEGTSAPNVWLSYVSWDGEDDSAPVEWFLEAAEQFLEQAAAPRRERGCGGRLFPLLALPVIGTGGSGGKQISGSLLTSLLELLQGFVARHPVDVVLIAKSRPMLSAANAIRRRFETPPSVRELLEPRLVREAWRLARLSEAGQLSLFLGSGMTKMVGLPSWSELLDDVGLSAGLDERQRGQLRRLELKEQAHVLQLLLAKQCGGAAGGAGGSEECGAVDAGADSPAVSPSEMPALQEVGMAELQRRVVARLRGERYSVAHALLAALPHDSAVTTNSDLCYDAACKAANVRINLLPYDTRASQRWVLKLHGDVDHPEDVVISYSSGAGRYGAGREALSGIVQALLITKHIMFVGVSLKDDAFNEVAAVVRRALGEERASRETFGTALTLSDRPFLSELWPDLGSVPMGDGATTDDADYGARVRKLHVFLDCVCLEAAARGAAHLLDPTLEGTLTADDAQLKREIEQLVEALRAEPSSLEPAAAAPIKAMLRRLGRTEPLEPGGSYEI